MFYILKHSEANPSAMFQHPETLFFLIPPVACCRLEVSFKETNTEFQLFSGIGRRAYWEAHRTPPETSRAALFWAWRTSKHGERVLCLITTSNHIYICSLMLKCLQILRTLHNYRLKGKSGPRHRLLSQTWAVDHMSLMWVDPSVIRVSLPPLLRKLKF